MSMNGFAFEIKNNLLEKKHLTGMGVAVWLFMWLDDKITRIDENGTGWVLGGKPIKYSEIKKDFGISRRTYARWVNQLTKYPYINAIRTPAGISYRIYKAHKKFGRKAGESDVTHSAHRVGTYGTSDVQHVAHPIKTVTVDKTVDTAGQGPAGNQINKIIELFKGVNPLYTDLYKNLTERKAVEYIISKLGFEKTKGLMEHLPEIVGQKFAPRITKPTELRRDMGKLIVFIKQESQPDKKGRRLIE